MIYTIGYSNRSLEEFKHEILSRNISHLIDVRSSPRSRNPQYTARRIAEWSAACSLRYTQEGSVLGGRAEFAPHDREYQTALKRVIFASVDERVAIFCAEGDPENCHRCYDVGATLLLIHGVASRNICRNGMEELVDESLDKVHPRRFDTKILAMLDTRRRSRAGQ